MPCFIVVVAMSSRSAMKEVCYVERVVYIPFMFIVTVTSTYTKGPAGVDADFSRITEHQCKHDRSVTYKAVT